MKGDVDGDGRITSADNDIIVNHVQGREYITDSTALLAADFDNSGVIDNSDSTRCTRIIKGSKKVGDYSLDILGHWLVNPNYSTEEMQFYTDIEVPGMSASSSATIFVKGSYEQDFFRAECIEGAIRIYAKLCPISEIKAIVQFSSGDGSAIVVCECTEPSNISRFVNITIPAGRMRGDINGDGYGEIRRKLIDSIFHALDCAKYNKELYDQKWDKIWNDRICLKYKRKDYEDYWLWNHDFYHAEIEVLQYIVNLVC